MNWALGVDIGRYPTQPEQLRYVAPAPFHKNVAGLDA
jgi:hypothetical protein